MHRFAWIAVIVLGCQTKATQNEAANKAPSAVVVPTGPTSSSSPEMRTLGGRLAYEAAHRPTQTLNVEDVMAALAKGGVVVADAKQYIALTAAASYCVGGHTAEGLAVAVCEYLSGDAATAGRAHVEKMFPNIKNREIEIHGATTMMTTIPEGKDLAALRTTAKTVFSAL